VDSVYSNGMIQDIRREVLDCSPQGHAPFEESRPVMALKTKGIQRWSRLFGQFGSKVKVELGYFLRCLTGSPFQGG